MLGLSIVIISNLLSCSLSLSLIRGCNKKKWIIKCYAWPLNHIFLDFSFLLFAIQAATLSAAAAAPENKKSDCRCRLDTIGRDKSISHAMALSVRNQRQIRFVRWSHLFGRCLLMNISAHMDITLMIVSNRQGHAHTRARADVLSKLEIICHTCFDTPSS